MSTNMFNAIFHANRDIEDFNDDITQLQEQIKEKQNFIKNEKVRIGQIFKNGYDGSDDQIFFYLNEKNNVPRIKEVDDELAKKGVFMVNPETENDKSVFVFLRNLDEMKNLDRVAELINAFYWKHLTLVDTVGEDVLSGDFKKIEFRSRDRKGDILLDENGRFLFVLVDEDGRVAKVSESFDHWEDLKKELQQTLRNWSFSVRFG